MGGSVWKMSSKEGVFCNWSPEEQRNLRRGSEDVRNILAHPPGGPFVHSICCLGWERRVLTTRPPARFAALVEHGIPDRPTTQWVFRDVRWVYSKSLGSATEQTDPPAQRPRFPFQAEFASNGERRQWCPKKNQGPRILSYPVLHYFQY